MISQMLFEDSKIEEKPKVEDGKTVRKGPMYLLAVYFAVATLFIVLGVLFFVFQPISQYLAAALTCFSASLAPIFFFIDFLVFRVSIGNGKISVRKLAFPETVYSYTDIAWKMVTPNAKRSAIQLYAKGKSVAQIYSGASGYVLVTTLRHKGPLQSGEKAILSRLTK